jgi:hypothetical protein
MLERTVTVIVVGAETAPGGRVTDAPPAPLTTPPEGPMTFEVEPWQMHGPKLDPSDPQTWPPAHPPALVQATERPGVHNVVVEFEGEELHASTVATAARMAATNGSLARLTVFAFAATVMDPPRRKRTRTVYGARIGPCIHVGSHLRQSTPRPTHSRTLRSPDARRRRAPDLRRPPDLID